MEVFISECPIFHLHHLCYRCYTLDAVSPDLVLLDLNLPRKDGREVLAEMKKTPGLMSIPVVILTTSQAEEDIIKSYHLQASCYVTKTFDFDQFIKIVRSIDDFWFTAVRYPPKETITV